MIVFWNKYLVIGPFHIPLAVMWVLVFAINKGIITRLFVNKILIALGNISPYAFLIHFVISLYVYYIFDYFGIHTNRLEQTMLVAAEFVVTVGLSVLYKRKIDK